MKSNDEYFFGGPLEVPGEPLKGASPANNGPTKKRPHKSHKKLLLVLLCLAILLGAAFAGWKFFDSKRTAPVAQQPNTENQLDAPEGQTSNNTDVVPEAENIKTFKADHPRISFAYPSTWTVSEKDNGIRIESPSFKYMTTDIGEVTGNFRIYIRQQARTADSKYIGDGIAIKPSEKLIYNDPAVGQLPETNLIHFGLKDTGHFAYFFIAGNYSLQQNDTLGPDYGKEPQTYIITGGYSSPELTEDMATHKVPLDYYTETSAFNQALVILKSLQII